MRNIIIILLTILSLSSFSQSNDSMDVSDTTIYTFADSMPEFVGGDSLMYLFLSKNITFYSCPNRCRKGKVYANFVVEKDGSLSSFKIIRKLCSPLDDEVLRVLKLMPKWEPGINKGKFVRVRFNLPVNFKLR